MKLLMAVLHELGVRSTLRFGDAQVKYKYLESGSYHHTTVKLVTPHLKNHHSWLFVGDRIIDWYNRLVVSSNDSKRGSRDWYASSFAIKSKAIPDRIIWLRYSPLFEYDAWKIVDRNIYFRNSHTLYKDTYCSAGFLSTAKRLAHEYREMVCYGLYHYEE